LRYGLTGGELGGKYLEWFLGWNSDFVILLFFKADRVFNAVGFCNEEEFFPALDSSASLLRATAKAGGRG
jgi:hypothetical protein